MLNRRTLRVKIMQSLFAYEQCKEANRELALDLINQRFTPDLNSMEVQDKPLLSKRKKEAVSLFQKSQSSGDFKTEDNAIAGAVDDAIAYYNKQTEKDLQYFKKNLVLEIEKINHWYFSVLGLLPALADASKADKKSDYSNFQSNALIRALKEDTTLGGFIIRNNLGWENQRNEIQGWFRDVLRPDKTFQDYLKESKPDLDQQKNIIKHIVRKLILGDTVINDYFQEKNIRWAEDHDIVKSLVGKTIKAFTGDDIQIQKLSMDWDDDLVFIDLLFEKATQLGQEDKLLISKNTKNWEVDRLPLTDRIILEMAIAELLTFPSIPVKVTINEYIELTKQYSTPKSSKFINGILDVIAKELQTTGRMKKSGRGLIDNK